MSLVTKNLTARSGNHCLPSVYRSLLLAAALACSGSAWSDSGMYDTHPQILPEKAKVEDCGALDDELSRLAKFARNPTATPKQLAANKARADKLEARRAAAHCAGKSNS